MTDPLIFGFSDPIIDFSLKLTAAKKVNYIYQLLD